MRNNLKQLYGEVVALRLQVAAIEARYASLKLAKAKRANARIAAHEDQVTDENALARVDH
jgi:hypothetical protein